MNAATPRQVAAFAGPVQCQRAAGNGQLHLHGRDAEADGELHVWINGRNLPPVLAALRDVRLFELQGEPVRWQLQAPGVDMPLAARSVQVHRPMTRVFNAAVPPVAAKPLVLALWATLLTLLRLPGAASLLRKFRGN